MTVRQKLAGVVSSVCVVDVEAYVTIVAAPDNRTSESRESEPTNIQGTIVFVSPDERSLPTAPIPVAGSDRDFEISQLDFVATVADVAFAANEFSRVDAVSVAATAYPEWYAAIHVGGLICATQDGV
jgi:hypothetical protein